MSVRVLAEAWHESGELRAWLTQEAAWLDGLQRRLRRSPNAPADAEEITDELYVNITRTVYKPSAIVEMDPPRCLFNCNNVIVYCCSHAGAANNRAFL